MKEGYFESMIRNEKYTNIIDSAFEFVEKTQLLFI